jgi:hypothetical protein
MVVRKNKKTIKQALFIFFDATDRNIRINKINLKYVDMPVPPD